MIGADIKKFLNDRTPIDPQFKALNKYLEALQTSVAALASKSIISNGSAVKSVQRGKASAAGSVTITAVNVSKTFALSVSKGSDGYVAARGSITLYSNSADGNRQLSNDQTGRETSSSTGALSGGATDLTVKEYSAYLTNATTLTCDGPCEWQVIEFY